MHKFGVLNNEYWTSQSSYSVSYLTTEPIIIHTQHPDNDDWTKSEQTRGSYDILLVTNQYTWLSVLKMVYETINEQTQF